MLTRPFGFSHCAILIANGNCVFMKRENAKETFNEMNAEHASKYHPYQFTNVDKENPINPVYQFKKGGKVAPVEPPSDKSSTRILLEGLRDITISTTKSYIKNGFKAPEPKQKKHPLSKSIRNVLNQINKPAKPAYHSRCVDASAIKDINKLIEFSSNQQDAIIALAPQNSHAYRYINIRGARFYYNHLVLGSILYHDWENKHLTNKLYYEYNSIMDGIIPRHRALLEVMRRYGAYYDNEDGLFKGYDEAELFSPEVFAQEVERYALDHP